MYVRDLLYLEVEERAQVPTALELALLASLPSAVRKGRELWTGL